MERKSRNPFEGHVTWDLRKRRMWVKEANEK